MLSTIIAAFFGIFIGLCAWKNQTDESDYIITCGAILGVIITYPIQMVIQVFI